jgi:uncharacterized membrane protein
MTDSQKPNSGVENTRLKRRWLIPLIFIPFFFTLWVPSFNTIEPRLAGVPFFYWYQMSWILLSAGLTFLVYLLTDSKNEKED